MTIAITIAYDDPQAEADLAAYRSHYGLPPCTTANGCFTKVNQRGEAGNYPAADSGWALETSLDLDMVSAACPGCDIVLVEADSNEFDDMALAVDRAAILGADAISNSWATEEFSGETVENSHFDHPGIPDSLRIRGFGFRRRLPRRRARRDRSRRHQPLQRQRPSRLVGDGLVRRRQRLQRIRGEAGLAEGRRLPRRTVADVSAVADPQTPVSVYDSFEETGWVLLGGTSVATPLLAGVEALSSNAFRAAGPGGFARAGYGGGLFDVTEGENGPCGLESDHGFDATYLCQGADGYDGPTGWGTPLGPQSLPVALTEGATVGSTEEATLHASVDPRGLATSYRFEYGTTTAYGNSVPVPDQRAGSGSGYVAVSETIAGLVGKTAYHYRITASSSAGTFHGVDRVFGTSPPAVTTGAAKEVHAFDASLSAKVNPEGLKTTYYFEYGLTTAYGSQGSGRSGDGRLRPRGRRGQRLRQRPQRRPDLPLPRRREERRRQVLRRRPVPDHRPLALVRRDPSAAARIRLRPRSLRGLLRRSRKTASRSAATGASKCTPASPWPSAGTGSSWSVMDTPNPPGLDDGWEHNWYAVLHRRLVRLGERLPRGRPLPGCRRSAEAARRALGRKPLVAALDAGSGGRRRLRAGGGLVLHAHFLHGGRVHRRSLRSRQAARREVGRQQLDDRLAAEPERVAAGRMARKRRLLLGVGPARRSAPTKPARRSLKPWPSAGTAPPGASRPPRTRAAARRGTSSEACPAPPRTHARRSASTPSSRGRKSFRAPWSSAGTGRNGPCRRPPIPP